MVRTKLIAATVAGALTAGALVAPVEAQAQSASSLSSEWNEYDPPQPKEGATRPTLEDVVWGTTYIVRNFPQMIALMLDLIVALPLFLISWHSYQEQKRQYREKVNQPR